jgi:transposase
MLNTNTRRVYDAEFKRNTVELYLSGNQTLSVISQDLNVAESTIYNWLAEYRKGGKDSFKPVTLSPQEKEILQLKKQLSDVAMERDILKKLSPSSQGKSKLSTKTLTDQTSI